MSGLHAWVDEYSKLTGYTREQSLDIANRITEEATASVFSVQELLAEEMRAARTSALAGVPPGTLTR